MSTADAILAAVAGLVVLTLAVVAAWPHKPQRAVDEHDDSDGGVSS